MERGVADGQAATGDGGGDGAGGDGPPVALVAGVTGGIGRAVAARLLDDGWRVAGYARDRGRLDALRRDTDDLHTIAADATDPDGPDRAVAETVATFGRLDAYVHAVGSLLLKPAHSTTLDEFRGAVDANLVSAFLGLKAALGPMRRQHGGAVVLFSSVAAVAGLASHEAIAAAKGGVAGLTLSAASTYARDHIRVNAIAPGTVVTPLTARLVASDSGRETTESMHPLGRTGRPEEVASLVAWLVSDEAGWITGQVWSMDGGMGALIPRVRR